MRERNTMRLLHMGCGESLSSHQLTTFSRKQVEQETRAGRKSRKKKQKGKVKR